MNTKAVTFLKNFSYAISSNLVTLIISTVVILIIPKYIGVIEYGYWQLYLFYTAYVGFLHFGWNDGIYLRFGGEKYSNLNKKKFGTQFHLLFIVQILFLVAVLLLTLFFTNDTDRMFIFIMTAICMVLVNTRYMLLFILQATNRIKEYATITIIDRILFAFLIIGLLSIGIVNFKLMIIFDLVGKTASLVFAMYLCKDIVWNKIVIHYTDLLEVFENIKVGIKLMLSTIASKLIVGNVRFAIERYWSVAVFGKVSLILSISGFVMLFINAVGIILFPLLRRSPKEKLPMLYETLRDFLMIFLFAVLIGYYPIKFILSVWLPDYQDALIFMAMLFPTIIYESKMALLLNTYFRTLRLEKLLLKINIITFILSLVITLITAVLIRNLELVILSITIVLAFRAILSEIILSRIIKVKVLKDIFFESLLVCLLVLSAWYIDTWLVMPVYTIGYCIYLLLKRKDIVATLKNIIELIGKKKVE